MTDTSAVDVQDTSQFAIVTEDVLLPLEDNEKGADIPPTIKPPTTDANAEHFEEPEEDEKQYTNPKADEIEDPSVSNANTNTDLSAAKTNAIAKNDETENKTYVNISAEEDIKQQQQSSEEKENLDEIIIENKDAVDINMDMEEKTKIVTRTKLHSGILMKKSRWLGNWRWRELILYAMDNGKFMLESYVVQNEKKVEDSKEEEEKILNNSNKEIKDKNIKIVSETETDTDTDNEEEEDKNINGSEHEQQPQVLSVRRSTANIELSVDTIESQVEKISFHEAKCASGFVFAVWQMNDNGQRKKEFLFRTESKRDRDHWYSILMSIGNTFENGSGMGSDESGDMQSESSLMKDTLNVLLMTLRKIENLRLDNGKSVGLNGKALDECEKKLNENMFVGMTEILEIQRELKVIAERDDGKGMGVVVDDMEVHVKVEEEENNQ